ncbi:MAG: hypothetical protein JJE39_00520 [Vicinamibacteria bacterium]|nr:hypothetical protein [Vicinamibacteria bacterium]
MTTPTASGKTLCWREACPGHNLPILDDIMKAAIIKDTDTRDGWTTTGTHRRMRGRPSGRRRTSW